MTPAFARTVDPIVLHVLELINRIERGDHVVVPQAEQFAIVALLDQASAVLGHSDEWELARYALVAWIDEMLLATPWNGRDWWNNNVLEVALFGMRLCYHRFYLNAQEASKSRGRDALEVYYNSVVLGFRGVYGDTSVAANWAPQHGLPPDLQGWLDQTGMMIRLRQGLPLLSGVTMEICGAPPLRAKSRFMWSCLLFLCFVMCNVVLYSL